MTRSASVSATLRHLRKEVARAHGPLFCLAALAHKHQLMDKDELRAFQALNKAGGERKLHTVARAEAVLAKFHEQRVDLSARLAANGIELPEIAPSDIAVRRIPKPKTMAERPSGELEEGTKRLVVVGAMATGSSAASALKRAGLPATAATRRWAQRLFRAHRMTGDIHDQRSTRNGAAVSVLTPPMRDLIEVLWQRHRDAPCSALRQLLEKNVAGIIEGQLDGDLADNEILAAAVRAGRVMLPSAESIRRLIRTFGKTKALVREKGWAEVTRQMRPTAMLDWATHANEEWQIDHTPMDLWAKQEWDGVWEEVRLYLTTIIDVYSRAIMGVVVSARYPDAFTTAHALRVAILPKEQAEWVARGTPERFVMDNGKDFRSQQVTAFTADLNVELCYCAPKTPDEKPQIERFFGTMTRQLLSQLPGYMHGTDRGAAWTEERKSRLLTVPQVRAEVLRWINEEYHTTVHRETKRVPMELWADSAVRLAVPSMRELDMLLMYEAPRLVTRGCVRLTIRNMARGVYWGPALTTRPGHQLVVKYNPDDLLSVFAYDANTREFVGELWNIRDPRSEYTDKDVRAAWAAMKTAERQRLDGLSKRTADYFAQSAAQDRAMKRRTGEAMDEARTLAAQLTGQSATPPTRDAEALQEDLDRQAYLDSMGEPAFQPTVPVTQRDIPHVTQNHTLTA